MTVKKDISLGFWLAAGFALFGLVLALLMAATGNISRLT